MFNPDFIVLACDPVTLMAASLAISAASAAAQHQSAKAQAEATARHQIAVSKAAAAQSAAHMSDQIALNRAEQLQHARERESVAEKASLVRSRAMVSAGESGVSGASIDALNRDYLGQEAELNWASQLNDQQARATMDRNLDRQMAAHTAKQVSIFRPINQPSAAAYALKAAGQGMAAVSTYYSGGFGTESKYKGSKFYPGN